MKTGICPMAVTAAESSRRIRSLLPQLFQAHPLGDLFPLPSRTSCPFVTKSSAAMFFSPTAVFRFIACEI